MALAALTKKELLEQLRTYKLIVLVSAFLIFGLVSPLTAKMLPELMKVAGESMVIQFPAPTALFALDQYLKNFSQMGLLIVVLVGMGAIAGERERGTAAMILCKPVSRASFVASKFLAYGLVLAGSLALAALACYYYVAILWEPFDAIAFAAANVLLGLYLLIPLGLTLFASALFRSQLLSGVMAASMFVVLSLIQVVPEIKSYSPGALLGWSRALVAGTGEVSWPALFVGCGIVVTCGIMAWAVIRNQEL